MRLWVGSIETSNTWCPPHLTLGSWTQTYRLNFAAYASSYASISGCFPAFIHYRTKFWNEFSSVSYPPKNALESSDLATSSAMSANVGAKYYTRRRTFGGSLDGYRAASGHFPKRDAGTSWSTSLCISSVLNLTQSPSHP